jgi:small subunit ribosomal protein S8e
LSVWHGDQHKRKNSSGRKIVPRKKKRYEKGFFPAETVLGKNKFKTLRKHGSTEKIRLTATNQANVSDVAGKTSKTEILRVIKNPANVDYDRRGVITKGTMIATTLGNAKVTSRPGQDGIVNAILVSKKGE